MRRRLGTRRSIRRLLTDEGSGAVPLWALRNAGCDVVTVIDGVTLGMLPAGVVRTGAVAAMYIGMLGAAAPAVAAPSDQDSEPAVTASAQPGATDDVAATQPSAKQTHDAAPSDDDRGVAAQLDEAAQWVEEVGEDVTVEQHDLAMSARDDAEQQAVAAADELKKSQADLDEVESQLAKSEKRLNDAQAEAEPHADSLAEARADVAEANAALEAAQQEYQKLEKDASGLTGILPGGASSENVAEAEAAVAAAEEAVQEAHSVQAARYAEFKEFAASVEHAEAKVAAANGDVADSQADVARAEAQANAADELASGYQELAASVDEAFRAQGLIAPATGGVTSPYGNRVHPVTGEYKLHTGTDFAATDGNYYAAMDGTVSYAAYDEAYGNMVKIDHGEIDGHDVETWYAHQPDLQVSVGQDIGAGEKIGDIGSTGYSTGPHAHFELRVDGNPIDPVPYIR